MFTRPDDLTDDEVGEALGRAWGLDVVTVEHAPVGFGSHHWQVATGDGCRWFATADDLRSRRVADDEPLTAPLGRLRAALTTAACLHEGGLGWVVAPQPAGSGDVVVGLGGAHALALYPLVEGRAFGWGAFEEPAHRVAVLERLAALHTTPGCRAAAGSDDLGAALVAGLRRTLDDPGRTWDAGPFGGEAWALLTEHGASLGGLLDRYSALVAGADRRRFVVTHGEPHRGNTIVTDGRGVVLVDWDTCLLAPPERDLWLLAREDAGVVSAYEAATGIRVEADLLEGYALRWDLADVAAAVRDLAGPHTDDEDTRTTWQALRHVLTRD